jgi:F-type H+-transporting ATPase subunit b
MADHAGQAIIVADVAPEPEHAPADTGPADTAPADAGHPADGELHAETGHAPAGEHKGGLPQLDTTTFASQLFWLVITFVTLYIVMSRVALPRLEGVMAERKGRIKGDIDAAAKAKRDSDAAIAGYEKALSDARAKALKNSDELRNKVQSEINAKNDEAAKQLAADTAKAEARIAEMRKGAMARVGDVAKDAAAEIVTKLTGEAANSNDIDTAVRNALKAS